MDRAERGVATELLVVPGDAPLERERVEALLDAALVDHAPLHAGKRDLDGHGDQEGQVRPRSGLAKSHGVTVLNAPGTIDADYRGEVVVLLVNLGSEPVTITGGQRIAQLVVAAVASVTVAEAEALPPSARGAGGFGSTGT